MTINHQTDNHKTVRVIDIRSQNVASFVDILATCKLVASASLHGIILAEAYNIKWSWVRLMDKFERQFKYHDFFLSLGIEIKDAKVSCLLELLKNVSC